jgi:hypothetical protein
MVAACSFGSQSADSVDRALRLLFCLGSSIRSSPSGGDIGGDRYVVSISMGVGVGALPLWALRWHDFFSFCQRNLARSLCVLLLALT